MIKQLADYFEAVRHHAPEFDMASKRETPKRAAWLAASAAVILSCAIPHSAAANTPRNYVDITHTVVAQMPVDPALKLPEMNFFGRIGENGGKHNLEVISYCPHTGTHMDSPIHVIEGASSTASWPNDILIGPAAIISVGTPGAYIITKEDVVNFEKQHGDIKEGEAVLFHTGHDQNWDKGYDAYIKDGYPTISPEAARYLADKKIRYVAVESISPEGDSTEVHQTFLGAGIPVVENVCNLGAIGAVRCETIGTFPAVEGATGVWVRLLAVTPR